MKIRKEKKWNIKNKMVEINPNILITINIIGSNSPVRGQRLYNTTNKQNPAIFCLRHPYNIII